MKKPYFFLLLIFLALFSCRQAKKITPDIELPGDSSLAPASFPDLKTYRGLFVVGRNRLSFRECDHPEKDFSVNDSTGKMKELYKTVFFHSPAFPFEYVYVEVKGEISAGSDTDLQKGFDSVITIKEVLTFEQKNYQNSCIPYDFWALGNDWSLQISQRESIMVFKDYSAVRAYVFEYFPPKNQNDEVFTYASNNYAAQASIKSVIKKEICFEDSSKNEFQYSVSVLINGKRFSGCAIKGSSVQ
jgi:uncharacterized membrane protein